MSNKFDFVIPELGENVEYADVSQLLVAVGDQVEVDQPLVEIENEKATFELPSPRAGKVLAIHVRDGDQVKVGGLVMSLELQSGAVDANEAESSPKDSSSSIPQQEATPRPAQAPSVADKPSSQPSTVVAASSVANGQKAATAKSADNGSSSPPPPAGPATRRLARELGVDLHLVKGTGPAGRISQEDVQAFVRSALSARPTQATATVVSLPDFSQWGSIQRQAMNKIARTSAQHLTHCWSTIPHVTQNEIADITELEGGRKDFSKANGGVKVTMTVLAMKAAVAALQTFPQANSSIDVSSGELILKQYYHIGVAVDTENGLLVPVIRDVDKKNVIELAIELMDAADRARNRRLGIDDMKGGTFTITNLGGIGGTTFTPIVNAPEVAILGMCRARWQPSVHDGQVVPRLILPLSLSYDHRVINGADGARFIGMIAKLLSDPFQLLSAI